MNTSSLRIFGEIDAVTAGETEMDEKMDPGNPRLSAEKSVVETGERPMHIDRV